MTSTSETKRSAVVREGNVHIKKKDIARSAFHNTSKMSLIQSDDSYIVPVRQFFFLQHDRQKESSSCSGWLLAFHRRYHYWCNGMIVRFKGLRKSVSAKKLSSFFFCFLWQTILNISTILNIQNDDRRLFLWLEYRRSSVLEEEVLWLIVVFHWASRVTSGWSLAR